MALSARLTFGKEFNKMYKTTYIKIDSYLTFWSEFQSEATMTIASVSETRQQLSQFLRVIKAGGEEVVIQNRGEAEGVLISYEDYAVLQAARIRDQRQAALDNLQRLAEARAPYNADLSEAEVEALADEVTRSAIDALVEKGLVRFQD